MTTVCELNKCNGCMACMDKCPNKCISILDNLYAYNAIKDMKNCISCGQCEEVCPNNTQVEKLISVDWKQGWAEWEVRSKSSSGGIASAITAAFIDNGGYVASCLFKDGEFIFDITNEKEMAKKFAGSKYVKSNPIGVYKKVQDRLRTDKVLFIGLPCQVAALRNFIYNQENLYTIDLICHGTPSPKILEQFLTECGYNIKEVKNLCFRNNVGSKIETNGITKLGKGRDSYLISFLNGINYTENCYSCSYATKDRVSDITLGDSWGTELKNEELNGVSLVLIQSEKGTELLRASNIELKDVDYEKAVKNNQQLNYPSVLKLERESFLKMITDGETVKRATDKTLPKQVLKQKIKGMLICLGLVREQERFKLTISE